MNAKHFRKIFLPSVIFLFSVLVLGQSAWTCDTPETPDDQCYEQLDIKSVHVDGSTMHILGKHLKNGNSLEVTFGGVSFPFDLWSNEEIVAIFPAVFEPGHYKLEVSTGEGHKCKDKQSVTLHHREEPSPPPPPTCPETCPQGCKGDKGDTGPQGPAGPAGPAALTNWSVLHSTPIEFVITDLDVVVQDFVSCPANFQVTGGGFSTSTNVIVTESKPFQDANGNWGWHVIAVPGIGTGSASIETWAVCVQVVQAQ